MTKVEIRQYIAERKKGGKVFGKMSEVIVQTIQLLDLFRAAHAVGLYIPLPDEVDISPVFKLIGKQFYVPAFDESLDRYRMAKYTPELKKGKFGIPEPKQPVWAEADELDLILVPGIAFDSQGNRLGRGGGFYDRLLPDYIAVRIGVCFDFQCLEKVETEPHDCRMDYLVTNCKHLEFVPNS